MMSSAFEHIGSTPRAGRAPGRPPVRSPLFDDVNQKRVRAELATFFGPRADVYLDTYEKMRAAPPAKLFPRTWSWPVFLGSFTWFFYRKMYGAGAVLIFLPMIFGYLFGTAGSGGMIVFAMSAKSWYVRTALGRIAKADEMGLTGADRYDYLQRAGGVSLTGGLLAGFVLCVPFDAFDRRPFSPAVIISDIDGAVSHRPGRDRSASARPELRHRKSTSELAFRSDVERVFRRRGGCACRSPG